MSTPAIDSTPAPALNRTERLDNMFYGKEGACKQIAAVLVVILSLGTAYVITKILDNREIKQLNEEQRESLSTEFQAELEAIKTIVNVKFERLGQTTETDTEKLNQLSLGLGAILIDVDEALEWAPNASLEALQHQRAPLDSVVERLNAINV